MRNIIWNWRCSSCEILCLVELKTGTSILEKLILSVFRIVIEKFDFLGSPWRQKQSAPLQRCHHSFWATLKKQAPCSWKVLVPVYQSTRRHIQQDGIFITGVTSSHLPRFTVRKRNNRRLDIIVSCEWWFRSNFLSREFQGYLKAQCTQRNA